MARNVASMPRYDPPIPRETKASIFSDRFPVRFFISPRCSSVISSGRVRQPVMGIPLSKISPSFSLSMRWAFMTPGIRASISFFDMEPLPGVSKIWVKSMESRLLLTNSGSLCALTLSLPHNTCLLTVLFSPRI